VDGARAAATLHDRALHPYSASAQINTNGLKPMAFPVR